MYKLIAIDMDGTLLNNDKKISKENLEAIRTAKEKGVQVVLSTGRPLKGVESYLEELDLINDTDYVVAFNGALVQNTGTQEVLSKQDMSIDDLSYLYKISKELDVNIHALTPTKCISQVLSKYTQVEVDINDIPFEQVDFNNVPDDTTIVKIMIIDEPDKLSKAIEKLPKEIYEKYTVLRSMPFFLEFLDKRVNKGVGVQALAEKLNIKREEVICIGDADNDLHMIDYAGLGVAMGNGNDNVKRIANYVTHSNEDSGVAHVINKFILNEL